ncbi:MAG: tryptophan 7-halogenase [Paracoccaceae bacterium]|nr:tryptophan 7-halogenase [Paracoccaceae bacterium]
MAHALGSGWMWKIPTQNRMGCGYVYSDSHIGPDEACREVESILGNPIEPGADTRIRSDRLDNARIGNSVGARHSQSFFEPLEATSIHGTVVQMGILSQYHLREIVGRWPSGRGRCNRDIARQVDGFWTFINMHYVTERSDTTFWRDVRTHCIGPETRRRLRQWSRRLPRRTDFQPLANGAPHIEEQLYDPAHDDLGLLDMHLALTEHRARPDLRRHARKATDALETRFRRATNLAPGHRAFLEAIRAGSVDRQTKGNPE